jgi:hypothetical protein
MKIIRDALIFVATILVGCANHPTPTSTSVPNKMLENSVCALVDNTASMAAEDATFYVYKSECFVTVYDFPEYKNIKWYAIPNMPPSVARACHFIIDRPGSPRLEEGGFRKCIYIQGQANREWFDQETPDIAKRFKRLRKALILEKYRVYTLPPWISDHPEIAKRFDLRGGG